MEPGARDAVSTLQSDLSSMVNTPLLSDLTVLTGDGSHLRAHGCILAARCPGFRQAVLAKSAAPSVLDLSMFSRQGVLLYLEKVYTAAIASYPELDDSTKRELQAIADK